MQAYEFLTLATTAVAWPRSTNGKPWGDCVYNAPVTFGNKPDAWLVKRVAAGKLARFKGPWSRAGFRNCVYNTPAFPARILSDEDLITRSSRAGRNPLIWQFRERAFLRAWDLLNNFVAPKEMLFLRMLSNEMLSYGMESIGLEVAQRVAAELSSWLGSPTGMYMFQASRQNGRTDSILSVWDFYNNGAANASNPLLIRLLSNSTKDRISDTNNWMFAEIMAANFIGWLDTDAGRKFVADATAEADKEAQAEVPTIRKNRLLLQTVGELPPPTDYERKQIMNDDREAK